ncbi:MAG: hypothetical protein QM800_11440 [Paludibacter sp.]
MNNWKSLLITSKHWECNNAENLLKLNGIKTIKKSVFMNNPDHPHEVFGAAKLIVKPAEYERGLQILTNNGFKTDEAIVSGKLVEIDI